MSSGEDSKEEEHIVVGRMGHWYKGEQMHQYFLVFGTQDSRYMCINTFWHFLSNLAN